MIVDVFGCLWLFVDVCGGLWLLVDVFWVCVAVLGSWLVHFT